MASQLRKLMLSGWLRDSDFPKPDPTRAEAMKKKTVNKLIDRLHIDSCCQDRVMLNGVQIKISLQANRLSFYFQATSKDTGLSFNSLVYCSSCSLKMLRRMETSSQILSVLSISNLISFLAISMAISILASRISLTMRRASAPGSTFHGKNFVADSSDPVDGHFNPLWRGNL